MNAAAQGSFLFGMGIFVVFSGQPAHAAEGPLLVVVEAPPALDADAAEIRRAIGTELHVRTIAPMSTPAEVPSRALVVALDRDRIAMSLRAGDGAPISRVIPAPAEPAARLRAIAWLAGNLARDQVTPIIAAVENAPSVPTATDPPPPSASPDTDDAASPRSSLEPPRFEVPAATVTAHVDPERARPASWTIGASSGPAISVYETVHTLRQSIFGSWPANSIGQVFDDTATIWRIEARHHTKGSRLFDGLALEGSTGFQTEPVIFGAMGFVGSALHLGRWSLEGSLGAGIEVSKRLDVLLMTTSNGTYGYVTSVTTHNLLRPGLFAAVGLGVSHAVFESFDLVLALDAHLSSIDESDGYLAATARSPLPPLTCSRAHIK